MWLTRIHPCMDLLSRERPGQEESLAMEEGREMFVGMLKQVTIVYLDELERGVSYTYMRYLSVLPAILFL